MLAAVARTRARKLTAHVANQIAYLAGQAARDGETGLAQRLHDQALSLHPDLKTPETMGGGATQSALSHCCSGGIGAETQLLPSQKTGLPELHCASRSFEMLATGLLAKVHEAQAKAAVQAARAKQEKIDRACPCAICLEDLNAFLDLRDLAQCVQQADREPFMLRCGHRYCRGCLQKLQVRACPICRRPISNLIWEDIFGVHRPPLLGAALSTRSVSNLGMSGAMSLSGRPHPLPDTPQQRGN
eukprot:SAG31_NODE_9481_length_1270_cov_1.396243_2_plen_244_part_00